MEQTAKQQAAERLRQATNVLVTVSKNPDVDQLASAIGLTLMLNRLGKHATAVFSGTIPAAVKFLEPEKHFDDNVDSLRDFIISLDKNKADKLRYKVEDDMVKIFITPYRTSLSDSDLSFGQGDYNVDVVVALGVEKRNDLDNAIISHGRILHDAAVVSVTNGDQPGTLGSIDWHDSAASSLSEMLVSISEALQGGLLDPAISTALLTGIVSATDRFSNEKTTPKVMTMAAQLMAAGANQQLIASNLHGTNAKAPAKTDSPTQEKSSQEKPAQAKPDHEKSSQGNRRKKGKNRQNQKLDELEYEVKTAAEAKAAKENQGKEQPAQKAKDEPKSESKPEEPKASEKPAPKAEEKPVEPPRFNLPDDPAEEEIEAALDRKFMPSREPAAPVAAAANDTTETPEQRDERIKAALAAVEQAQGSEPFRPENQPLKSIGALPMPSDPQVLANSPIADQLPLPGPIPPLTHPAASNPVEPFIAPADQSAPVMPPFTPPANPANFPMPPAPAASPQAFPMPSAPAANGQPPASPPPFPPPFQ